MAWLAVVPCALATLLAIVVIGPVIGDVFLKPGQEAFLPIMRVKPWPAEHGRFLVGLLGPPLLAAIVLASAGDRLGSRIRLRAPTIRALVSASQALAIGFVVLCFAAQNDVVFSADFVQQTHARYFTWPTLAVAAILPLLALAVLRRRKVAGLVAQHIRETRPRRAACAVVAGLLTTAWMLTAVNLDSSIGNTIEAVTGHLLWTMNETFAVLDGRTPLVSFHAQYGQLWAYLTAAVMAVLGSSIGVYTTVMAIASGLTMLGLYGVLRRVTRSSLAALALYAPFIATSFFMIVGPLENRYGPANLYILWPIRFAGPYATAWLVARHLDGAAPRRAWVPFLAAGLTALNNPDFGLASGVATLAALASVAPPRTWRAGGRLLGSAAIGVCGAFAAVTLLTLVRSGSLPRFGLLSEFSRLYGIGGWAQLPMPELGLYLAVFLTFAATTITAAARVASAWKAGHDREALLTAMLAWSGVFGLIASVYYGGRAHPMALFDFFSPWALSIALLLVVVARNLAARAWRKPTLPELAVLFGFGLAVCSLPQTPTPWSQIRRIRDTTLQPKFKQPQATRFVDRLTRPGEKVEILIPLGHRIAYDLHLTNVSPYTSIESMPTFQQLQRAIDTLRREHATKVFITTRVTFEEQLATFQQAGFAIEHHATEPQGGEIAELVDHGPATR